MVSQLFPGSFKKQTKFIGLIRQMKELDTVQKENFTLDSQASPILHESHVPSTSTEQFPSLVKIPKFPKDLQKRLENKEPCHKNSTGWCKIVLQDSMAQYTLCMTKWDLYTKENLALKKNYAEARGEALAEHTSGMDFRAALVPLPTVFRQKLDNYVTLGKEEQSTPYPTVQLLSSCGWRKIFCERRNAALVKMHGLEICRTVSVEDGILAVFCAYFTFNVGYPKRFSMLVHKKLKDTDFAEKTLQHVTEVKLDNVKEGV
ncbi:hypothetical protein AOLI_G00096270 [Acnodon oligacanthus]